MQSDVIAVGDTMLARRKYPSVSATLRRWHASAKLYPILVLLLGSAFLLFFRLGGYSLWDDEAATALFARGILRTGDTSALLDHNLVAYRGGAVLHNLKDRMTPPLPSYITAAAFSVLGQSSASARIPFALAGFAAVVLVASQAARQGLSPAALGVLAMAVLGNVSFFLFSRQCRYYALAMALSVVIVQLYLYAKRNKCACLAMAAASVALFATNYLSYAALYACLAADYMLWERRERPLGIAEVTALFAPQLLLVLPLAMIWNPFSTPFGVAGTDNTVTDRLILWLWYWRDLNTCELLSGGALLVGLVASLWTRDRWLQRGLLVLLLYVTCLAVVSPQTVGSTHVADIRYAAPLIPLAIVLGTRVVLLAAKGRPAVGLAIGAITFGTNLVNGGPLLDAGFRSTPLAYIRELADPPPEPYAAAADWIRRSIPLRASVWVLPDHMTYPLMFHAPEPVYAWQLAAAHGQFAHVAPIHVRGEILPEFIIAFGPIVEQLSTIMQQWQSRGIVYDLTAALDVYWKDMYRPELFWRRFRAAPFNPEREGIYVFRIRLRNQGTLHGPRDAGVSLPIITHIDGRPRPNQEPRPHG